LTSGKKEELVYATLTELFDEMVANEQTPILANAPKKLGIRLKLPLVEVRVILQRLTQQGRVHSRTIGPALIVAKDQKSLRAYTPRPRTKAARPRRPKNPISVSDWHIPVPIESVNEEPEITDFEQLAGEREEEISVLTLRISELEQALNRALGLQDKAQRAQEISKREEDTAKRQLSEAQRVIDELKVALAKTAIVAQRVPKLEEHIAELLAQTTLGPERIEAIATALSL
jgi:hypothetical protein